jgi:thiamine pyrophosphokinase
MAGSGSSSDSATVLVLAGGDPVDGRVLASLPAHATVVAADSGLEQALRLGIKVDVVVGDFDSVDPDALLAAERAGTAVERHPAEKDHTDLELAVLAAQRLRATRVIVVGGWGGRIDHALANLLLLANPDYAPLHLEAIDAGGRVVAIHDRAELVGAPGAIVTLLAVGGPATGVTTHGLRYRLQGETLLPGSTRGVSNVFLDASAIVSLESGALLALLPIPEVA